MKEGDKTKQTPAMGVSALSRQNSFSPNSLKFHQDPLGRIQ